MMKLESVSLFTAVADAGSISAAARRLGIPKSVASERLADLETTLGTRLVQRSTRKITLTEDGLTFLERARRIIRDVEEAAAELAERRGELSGPLRLSVPVSFSALHLGQALYSFIAKYPGIEPTLDLNDRFVDIAADGFDAVIRHGIAPVPRFHNQKLASSRRVLVASPDYLATNGTPSSLDALRSARGILYSNRQNDWCFVSTRGLTKVQPGIAMRVNNGLVMRDAALAGLGVALLPEFLVHREVIRGELKVVDVGAEAESVDVVLAHLPNQSSSAKLKVLASHLRETFGDPPYWQLPQGA